ncbi:helix-turn-helix domain-containing protein [Paenibacillus sp. 2TAB26]|uniref:helix-turn-helix domain-containing protein n=1 Tax=Paenibacillus sp. 2TAB26 TaxID=3233005 RepID=UPI003F9964B0
MYDDQQKSDYKQLEGMWFKLRAVEKNNSLTGNWSLRMQFIESHMLVITASGKGWITVDGRYYELRAGSAYVCTPGQLVEASMKDLGERGLYIVRFDVFEQPQLPAKQEHNYPLGRNMRFPITGEVVVSSMIVISALCEAMAKSMRSDNDMQRLRGQIEFYELVYSLLRDGQRLLDNNSEADLERAKTYIEQHYREDLTIEQLAKEAGVSSRHFIRLFKQRYGCSAIEYLSRYRIGQAQELMRPHHDYQLKDISSYVGYQDEVYFRRKFKQITGTPPAAFMRYARQKIVAFHANMIGNLLALNITPHAAPEDHPWVEYYRRKYDTSSVLSLAKDDDVKIEQIRSMSPDFIVGLEGFMSLDMQKTLNGITSTYFLPWEHDWRMHLRLIAEKLGKTAEAEVWLDRYERKAAAVRERTKSVLYIERLLIVRISEKNISVLANRSLGEVFYDDLHIMPATEVNRDLNNQQLTQEELAQTDADRLLLIVDEDAQSQAAWQDLKQSAFWGRMRPIRNNRIDYLPPYPWTEYTAFTQELILDEVLKLWRNRA